MLVTVVLAFVLASFQGFDVMLLCSLLSAGMASVMLFLDRKRPAHLPARRCARRRRVGSNT